MGLVCLDYWLTYRLMARVLLSYHWRIGVIMSDSTALEQNWIPGDNPDDAHGWYLVTVLHEDGGLVVYQAWFNKASHGRWYHRESVSRGSEVECKVIAHMPLPKPYSAQEEYES